MNTTTTTPAATVKKQFNVGATESLKEQIAEMAIDFTRPAAVKNAPPVKATEKELLEMILMVATDRRFKPTGNMVEVKNSDGNIVVDADGQPIMEAETIDLFEIEWNRIKARDYSDTGATKDPIAVMEASIRNYGKKLNMSKEAIEAMITNVKAAAPVEA